MSESKFERILRCPACGGVHLKPARRGTLDVSALNAEAVKITDSEYGKVWDLSRCLDCGHLFADPAPKPAFIVSLYQDVEDPLYDTEAEGRSKNFRPILARLAKLAPGKGRLFDVGAATGILLDLARRDGWERYGIPLRQGSFEESAVPAGSCRAVTMVDLIEHTPRPRAAVAKAASILAPGGVVCIVTPDIHSPLARLAGRRWWHLRPGHLAYFSRTSLDALLQSAGFRVILRKRYAWTFSAHYLVSRFPALGRFAASRRASFLKRIPIKLALGDSFEIYAVKEKAS
jgi:SAM-dependent methyltransferase